MNNEVLNNQATEWFLCKCFVYFSLREYTIKLKQHDDYILLLWRNLKQLLKIPLKSSIILFFILIIIDI